MSILKDAVYEEMHSFLMLQQVVCIVTFDVRVTVHH